MQRLRLAIVGFGTVGRWLAQAIHQRRGWLKAACGVDIAITGMATREGFVHCADGFDVTALLARAAGGRALADYPGVRQWETALAGLAATESDVLAEASNTNPRVPEPALSHIRLALSRGMDVITSSKGACAAAAVELSALARRYGGAFRMESTVMSGTPVLSTLQDGLAGARIEALRGILNATANHILTQMAEGRDYAAALADAQVQGYAEPDPSDDVDGHDVVAKARILAAVAFGRSIALDQVIRRGISGITSEAVRKAARQQSRLKLLAIIRAEPGGGGPDPSSLPLEVRVAPVALPLTDPLSRVDGVMNALTVQTDTVGAVTIIGAGAGPEQAGQGMFADLVAVARSRFGPGRPVRSRG